MGVPSTYIEEIFPKLFIKAVSFLGFLRSFILTFLNFFDLPHFIEPETCWPEPKPEFKSISANLIQEMLPVMKFADIRARGSGLSSELNPTDKCVICLNEFHDHEEIRRLANCKHVLHRECVDRWMDHDQRTCPLCRTSVIPDHLVDVYNERLQAAAVSCFPEFGSEFSVINSFL